MSKARMCGSGWYIHVSKTWTRKVARTDCGNQSSEQVAGVLARVSRMPRHSQNGDGADKEGAYGAWERVALESCTNALAWHTKMSRHESCETAR